MSNSHEPVTSIAQLEQDIKQACWPAIEAIAVAVDEMQAAVQSMGKSLSVEEPPKRKPMPVQHRQQARRRIGYIHSFRYQPQR